MFFRDVDARHRTDEQRDAELRELTAVLEALPSATVLVGEDGRILVANRAWRATGSCSAPAASPGGVGDDYLGWMSRGLRPADHAGIVAGFGRLQAEPDGAAGPSSTSTPPSSVRRDLVPAAGRPGPGVAAGSW